MIYLRKANDRGHANHGWLDTWHSFSFADYYDPNFMGFSALRVINEDVVEAGQGFGTHPHKDMEILTYVLEGAVEHQDSMGNKEQVPAGEFQIMSAGTGIRHSEYNPNRDQRLRLYQIWIIPERTGITPRYEQRRFDALQGRQLVLSPDARDGSLKVYQDMELWRWALNNGEESQLDVREGRHVWIQVVKGEVTVNGTKATTSDGLAIRDEKSLTIQASQDSEILLFDLPPARSL
ncbi:pirin family protein [Erwinia sp. CPCC 100877]|nr:pirin family protein [Erwinia sp. CPCC 100877]